MLCVQGLRQRIRDSYEARWKAEKHFDEEEIMQELPNSLRTEACPSLSLCPGQLCSPQYPINLLLTALSWACWAAYALLSPACRMWQSQCSSK